MSDEYPKKYPYAIKAGEQYLGWTKTCAHCSSTVEYPMSYHVYLAGAYLCKLTDHSRTEPFLCNTKCAQEFFWREFQIRRLNGQFN